MNSPSVIVAKFGGSSLANAPQIRKVAAIVRADARRRFVVVSAPGKRDDSDQKITDLLITCWHLASQNLDYSQPLEIISERYRDIARDLELQISEMELALEITQRELASLARGEKSLATRDWMAARGEFLMALLLAAFLGATFVPVGECVIFGHDNQLDEISYANLSARMSEDNVYVIPGFYGRDQQGKIKTFPRGGSDITGAVVARAVGAQLYENWTDVSGLLMADPRIVEKPKPIGEVTYRELRELSYMGASVLHEETIFPAREAGIPIHIKNTNAPEDKGTLILEHRAVDERAIIGVAGKPGFTTITLEKSLMNQQRGFGRRVLEVFEAHDVSWEHAPTGIDSMSIVSSDEQLGDKLPVILDELGRILEPDSIDAYPNLALIATVGEGMAYRVGVAGTLFEALRNEGVNVRMITQGASEINILVGVDDTEYQRAIRAIYAAFVD